MENLDFDSTDLAAVEDVLSRNYAKMRITGDRERPHTTLTRRWLGELNFDQLSVNYEMGYDADPLNRICICRVHSGRIVEDFIGEPTDVWGPGDVTLFSPPELPYSGSLLATYDLTMFDPGLLNRVAATAQARHGDAVHLTAHRTVSDSATHYLNATIDHIRDHALDDPEAAASPLVVSTATAYLAAAVLYAFPNNAVLEPTSTDRNDAKPVLLQRAISYVDDNAHGDITVTDIAAHVFVTPRALQYMFRRHLDCTPMDYVRRVRIDHAHRDLVAGDPSTTTVGAIARRWGFAHVGRFAAYYREQYGESPSATLHR
jgi:AraC-like DNA-binding protein